MDKSFMINFQFTFISTALFTIQIISKQLWHFRFQKELFWGRLCYQITYSIKSVKWIWRRTART